jgi:tetratricopeptide (TPR) repeat protein
MFMGGINATIRRLNELIERNPENAEFLIQRGYAWQDAKDFGRAMADFERAVAIDPFCVNALAASANLRYKEGDYDGSIDDSSRAIGIEPDNVMALCTRAASYLQKGEPERALEGFEHVLKLTPGQRGALHWRGVAKEALGDVEGAQRDFALSTALKPPLMPD